MPKPGAALSGSFSLETAELHKPTPDAVGCLPARAGEGSVASNFSAADRSQHARCSEPSIGARCLSWAQYPRRPAIDLQKWRHEAHEVVERWQTQHLEVSA